MADDTDKQILLQRIYVKDCSFESPRSPAIFATQIAPVIKVNMNTNTRALEDGSVEVVLSVTAEASHEAHPVFLVEVQQAGVFSLKGFNQQEQALILSTYCPNILFPYLREAVSDLTLKGGMAPLLLQPVNFDALYAQQTGSQAAVGN
ncbi:MAG: protein-export chaperone SecB [Gammaproteobacteria bacterium]